MMMTNKNTVSVLVVSASRKTGEYFTNILSPAIYYPITFLRTAGEAKRMMIDQQVDIIIIYPPLSDEYGTQFALDVVTNSTSTGVLMLVKSDMYEQISYKMEEYGILTMSIPNNRQNILQTINLLHAANRRLKALENKTLTLEAKMKEIRLVNRAKWILIDRLKMTEPQAHRYIEKISMDRCVKRSEIAQDIIRTYENQ